MTRSDGKTFTGYADTYDQARHALEHDWRVRGDQPPVRPASAVRRRPPGADMTGPVTRWLRRPMFWTSGFTVGGVLFLALFAAAGAFVLLVFLSAAMSRTQ